NIGANMGSIVANGAGSTGVLTINTGTATFTSGATVGTTDVRSFIAIGQNSTASGTSTGTINLNGGTLATGRNFVRDGAGTADASGSATFNFAGGTLKALANQTDWLNSATINTNQLALTSVTATNTSTIDAGGFSVAINSAISGTGGFNITNSTGTGTVTFGGANTYSGATTVSAGTFSLGNALALQNSALDTTASIAGTSTAGLKTTVTTLTMGGLTGNKDLASVFTTTSGGYSGVTALTLNPGTGVTNAYSGVIADGAAGMTLTKTGLGTQTLTGANTYTGGTIVTTGTLLVKNTTGSGTGTGTVSVSGTLGGTGIITGDTTINSGGVLTAGATTAATDIGTLAFSGALTLASLTSTINLQAASTSSYDKFTVGGALTYNGIFSVSDTGGFDLSGQNGTYNLFSGFTSQTGDFASVTVDGIGLSLVGSTWSGTNAGISYSFSETSGSLDITAVPEPSTWVGAGLITGLAGWSQRRRLQKLALRA
ncbi:MAG: autotransporter-associated beta strand repeat-containing protein, partial [Chthoniobacterales bacterium]